ncbi:F-box protein At5g39250-like [Lycium ferocissimum]|uniref:F-box protein At5g39250-like n=1 Tax=Lycium ferocissimum TaxID=112874 RepID=UPI002815B595|nr:F-box protein At5g39250-like [Lycium ferocissimum]
MTCEEILEAVFPLLEYTELANCMLVCKQWRDAAQDDHLWKSFCSKIWPSICKQQSPPTSTYYLFFRTYYKKQYETLPPPKLTFNDLEFYIDILVDGKILFSDVVPGPDFQKIPPPEIGDVLRSHIEHPKYKLILPVEPRFTIHLCDTVSFSVFVERKDTKKVACLLNKSIFHNVYRTSYRALGFDEYLDFFSPLNLFVNLGVRAWISLLFMDYSNEAANDIFAIEMDFSYAAKSEDEVLWLLDMLDWK